MINVKVMKFSRIRRRGSTLTMRNSAFCISFLPHQQVVQQDGHDNEEDNPKDVAHFWEGGLQASALTVVTKYKVILKLPKGHHNGLDEGETGIPKGGDIVKGGGTIWLYTLERKNSLVKNPLSN